MTEADTCRKLVLPKLVSAGWDSEPHSFTEQRSFTDGRTMGTEISAVKNSEDAEKETIGLRDFQAPFNVVSQLSTIYTQRPAGECCFDGVQVEIDADGKQLRVVKLTDYTAEKVWTRAKRAKGQRLNAKVNVARTVSAFSLQHSAFPHSPRRQRADRLKQQHVAFFEFFAPEAREILNELLEKYAADGEVQFSLPDILKVPPLSQHGTVGEIAKVFGGNDQLRSAVTELQTLLYAA